MKFRRLVYSRYCFFVFALLFLLLLPFFLVLVQRKQWHYYAYLLNHYWAKVFYALCFFSLEVVYKSPLDKKKQYIFCPNHTSFLDIPLMGFTPVFFVFVGKSSISKVPLFGYMYRKLHITVDRSSLKSKYETIERSKKAIEEGKSLVIFPEGGIVSKEPPTMARFKDGAFRVAIEKQIPIIPVTIPYNWIILPDDGTMMVTRRRSLLIFHEPVSTKGLEVQDMDQLKDKVYRIIDLELAKYNSGTRRSERSDEEAFVKMNSVGKR